ncbi:MAG: methyltransferase domain-containing protein [Candidatus Omnitrophota bacterium]|nr:methyltransferase domain-containing protein [Candidatus Omnitrophota bacterium]
MWKKEYKQKKFYWGLKPDLLLVKFLKFIPKGAVLDIGAGEGRNSIFLAENNFRVEAIDKIAEGLIKCKNFAKQKNLSIKTKLCDIRKFDFKKNKHSLIIAVASLDFLKKSEIKKIIFKIKKSLQKEGIIYIVVFTTQDPVYKKLSETKKPIEINTFYSERLGCYRHFFAQNELKKIFKEFEILHYQEYLKKDAHPDPHYHGLAEIIAKKGSL